MLWHGFAGTVIQKAIGRKKLPHIVPIAEKEVSKQVA